MRYYKKIAGFLAIVLFCSGCGQQEGRAIPKLKEPAAVNDSYRPVQYGSIGKLHVSFGTVVPEDYCHYYNANVILSEISVKVGDMVNPGDILAYANVEEAQKTLKDYQKQLSFENSSYALNQEISRVKQEKLAYQNAPDKEISTEQENACYDTKLHEYRVANLQKSIDSLQKIIEDGTLRARHSGQVTYTKNLGKGLNAGANENIVIVSDLTDTHLELTDTNIRDYNFLKYKVKYTMVAGKKIPVTEEEYSAEEKVLSEINHTYPNVRFACPEGYSWTLGEVYPIYFQKEDIQNVLIVGNDSLYTEGEDSYVYVKTQSGEKEKRPVEAGVSDENYTQIKEGLTEGEPVYYHSTARMPAEYTEYTVSLSDFAISKYGSRYYRSDANVFPCLSSYDGEITEMAVSINQTISKGDLLYIIDTGEGRAAITEARNAINAENASYQQMITSYDEQIAAINPLATTDDSADYELQILNLQRELAGLTHENTLYTLQNSYNAISSGNDGTGKVSVYAPISGTISDIDIEGGDKAEIGNQILQITSQSDDTLRVVMESGSQIIADVGANIKILKNNKLHEGTCIGWGAGTNNFNKGFVCTDEEGKAHLSYYGSGADDAPTFYIRMNEASFIDNMGEEGGKNVEFTSISMHNVVVLPSLLIYSEADPLNAAKVYYYVWRLNDTELIKQYVLIDENLKADNQQVVLSGISPGDTLAME